MNTNDHFTNEYHDVAQEEAFDLGFGALHGMAPDEVMMRREEEMGRLGDGEMMRRKAECLLSVIMAVTFDAASVEVIRDRVAVIAALNAPEMCPNKLWRGQVEFARARATLARCQAVVWEPEAGRIMLGLMTRKGWSAREVGLAALTWVYCYQSNKALRPKIARSFEAIGHAVGLKAENVRSAICAAIQRGPYELEKRMARSSGEAFPQFKFWFMKSAHCKEALAEAMKGKQNRHGRDEDAVEVDIRQGIPVRAEFAGMSPVKLRECLRQKWEHAEMVRLVGAQAMQEKGEQTGRPGDGEKRRRRVLAMVPCKRARRMEGLKTEN